MFEMLDIGNPKWVAAVMGLSHKRRDIHFDQRILAPYVGAYGWKAHLAFTEGKDGYIVQPILQTPEGDLRHAYNFGGPMGSTDLINSTEHSDSLNEWASFRGIKAQHFILVPSLVKEQLRLLSSSGINPEYKKQSVIIDLELQKVRGTTRRLANKALKAGVVVKAYPADHLKHFIDIYNATLDRVDAKDHWRFSNKWFELFARFLKPCLLLAEFGGKFESGCLVMFSQQYPVAYYHFAGCLNNHPSLGINHQMILAACEYARVAGMKYMYLGGGLTDSNDDGLLIFKSGFSQLKLPVYSYEIKYYKGVIVENRRLVRIN